MTITFTVNIFYASFADILSTIDGNIISVDWEDLARGPFYNQAKENAKITGYSLGHFIKYMMKNAGATPRNMHCIGFSLGAHICGFAGKILLASKKLGRITGLDPALPLFHYDRPDERLNIDDANFVDVIHTSGGFIGFDEPLGHADFYPNDGTSSQPGCGVDLFGKIYDPIIKKKYSLYFLLLLLE
jgi:hypothetical protein